MQVRCKMTLELPYKLVHESPQMSKDANSRELMLQTKLVKLTFREIIGFFTNFRVGHWYCTVLHFLDVCSVFTLEFFVPIVIVKCGELMGWAT